MSEPQPLRPPFPRNVPLFKGALVSIDDSSGKRTTVPFQFNPETLRRSLKPNLVGAGEGDRTEAVRFTGAAVEMIHLEVQLDGIDQLAAGNATASEYGIYPLLASLEQLVYPSVTQVKQYNSTLTQGSIDVVPPLAPRLVFVWGTHRVVPVRLTSLAITEQLYDGNLSPIAAAAALELRVLTYSDVFPNNPDYSLFLTHQQNLETMAGWVQPKNPKQILGVDPNSLRETPPASS